jgi:hypothetical protein
MRTTRDDEDAAEPHLKFNIRIIWKSQMQGIAMTIDRNEMNFRLVKLSESPNIRFWRLNYDQLSFPERVFGLIWELESEVNNGGFHQYFLNSTGALAPYVVDALTAVGAVATAGIAQQALALVGPDVSWSDDAARKAHMHGLPLQAKEKLHELDQAFYAYPDDLTTLLYRYAAVHRSELGAPADF